MNSENEEEIIITEKKKNLFSWLHLQNGFVQIILFVSAFLIGYFFINYSGQIFPSSIAISKTPTPSPTEAPYPTVEPVTPSPTAIPVTYTPLPTQSAPIEGNLTLSNVNGYSINYPPKFSITTGGALKAEVTKADLIWVMKETNLSILENPYMQIVFFTLNETHYKDLTTIKEVAEKNFHENTGNNFISSGIIEPVHETSFGEKKVYVYTFNCKGFNGIYESATSIKGVCKMIFGEHNNKYFFIGYYQIPEFEQIISSLRFN